MQKYPHSYRLQISCVVTNTNMSQYKEVQFGNTVYLATFIYAILMHYLPYNTDN